MMGRNVVLMLAVAGVLLAGTCAVAQTNRAAEEPPPAPAVQATGANAPMTFHHSARPPVILLTWVLIVIAGMTTTVIAYILACTSHSNGRSTTRHRMTAWICSGTIFLTGLALCIWLVARAAKVGASISGNAAAAALVAINVQHARFYLLSSFVIAALGCLAAFTMPSARKGP